MDFLKVIFIIAFVVLTIFTVKNMPEMHQPLILEDQDFVLTRISDTITTENVPVTISEKPAKIVNTEPAESVQKVISDYNKKQTQTVEKVVKIAQAPKTEKKVTTKSNPTDDSQLELLKKIMKNAENAQIIHENPPTTPKEQPKTEPKTQPKEQTPKTVEVTQPKSNSNPYMTEQEEIIAWNVWRSNIQNQIMKDSNIDFAPLGTIFTFTFVVDKFGNVSNIKVECSHPNFMDVARDNVKPAIANLQKKPILNFPKGTKRTSTVVQGMFLIGTQTRYSTPANYSDYEKVR